MLGQARGRANKHASEVCLEARVCRLQQLGARYHDNVHTVRFGKLLVTAENLSNQSLSAISSDRVAELPRGDDSQPRARLLTAGNQEGEESALHALTLIEHRLELSPPSEPLFLPKTTGRLGAGTTRRHGQIHVSLSGRLREVLREISFCASKTRKR